MGSEKCCKKQEKINVPRYAGANNNLYIDNIVFNNNRQRGRVRGGGVNPAVGGRVGFKFEVRSS